MTQIQEPHIKSQVWVWLQIGLELDLHSYNHQTTSWKPTKSHEIANPPRKETKRSAAELAPPNKADLGRSLSALVELATCNFHLGCFFWESRGITILLGYTFGGTAHFFGI